MPKPDKKTITREQLDSDNNRKDTIVSCKSCGEKEVGSISYWLLNGWPKCHNEGMYLESTDPKAVEFAVKSAYMKYNNTKQRWESTSIVS